MYVCMLYYLTDNNAVRLQRKCNKQQHNISRSLPTTNEIYCQSLQLAHKESYEPMNLMKSITSQEREKLSVQTSTKINSRNHQSIYYE